MFKWLRQITHNDFVYAYCWYTAYMFYVLQLTLLSILSKGLSIFLLLIWIVLVKISAVFGELCPSTFCKYLKLILFSIQCIANEWYKVYAVAKGLEMVSVITFLKIVVWYDLKAFFVFVWVFLFKAFNKKLILEHPFFLLQQFRFFCKTNRLIIFA